MCIHKHVSPAGLFSFVAANMVSPNAFSACWIQARAAELDEASKLIGCMHKSETHSLPSESMLKAQKYAFSCIERMYMYDCIIDDQVEIVFNLHTEKKAVARPSASSLENICGYYLFVIENNESIREEQACCWCRCRQLKPLFDC